MKKTKHKFSIRFTVVSLFLLLGALIVITMFYLQLNTSTVLATKSANRHFSLLSKELNNGIMQTDKLADSYINLFETMLISKHVKQDFLQHENLLSTYTTFLEHNNNLYSVHVSNENGFFFEIIKLGIDDELLKIYHAKKGDKWLMVEIDEHQDTRKLTLLDQNLNITSVKNEKTDYVPSTRPWFIKAKEQEGKVIKTLPYQFKNIHSRGITYAKALDNNSVFATDILMATLDKMLEFKEYAKDIDSMILDKDLNIIAHSNKTNNNKLVQKIRTIFNSDKNSLPLNDSLTIDNEQYTYYFDRFGDDFLLSYANIATIAKPFQENFKTIGLVSIVVFLLFFPVIWYFASIIVKPIMRLAKENAKIEKLKFDKVKKVNSHISEIAYLSKSFVKMAKSIKQSQQTLEQKVLERTKELEILSITDKLTGLLNRMKIDEKIENELERFNRYGKSFGLIFVDIDHFKPVNDTYGHQVGDDVLREFANILQSNARKTDTVGRWGGEEFIILCIEINQKFLEELAEKIRKIVENYHFKTVGNKTASFGITLCKENETLEQIVDRADKAMYKAKQNGRNRVEAIY